MSVNIDKSDKSLAVFDFDWTLIDDNSDTYFLDVLEPKFSQKHKDDRKQFNCWADFVDHKLGHLHGKGYSSHQILRSFETISIHPKMKDVIRYMEDKGLVLRILSDANNLFIDKILNHHKLKGTFNSVTTNHAYIEEKSDRIRVTKHHFNGHKCSLCPPSLCKGQVLKEWDQFNRVIYFGDGFNDLCPVLDLKSRDVAFVRSGKGLSKYLNSKDKYRTNAQVVYWNDAEDLLAKVLKIGLTL